jgi:hypothetical protein
VIVAPGAVKEGHGNRRQGWEGHPLIRGEARAR